MTIDESRIIARLDLLPERQRAVFAALCAERLAPGYDSFVRYSARHDRLRLRNLLDVLWADLQGCSVPNDVLRAKLDECMALLPNEDEGGPNWLKCAYAEDAIAAVAYAYTARLTGSSQESAWAARRVCDSLYQFIVDRDHLDVVDRVILERIFRDPLLRGEIAYQQADLDDLCQEIESAGAEKFVATLRTRARTNAYTFLAS